MHVSRLASCKRFLHRLKLVLTTDMKDAPSIALQSHTNKTVTSACTRRSEDFIGKCTLSHTATDGEPHSNVLSANLVEKTALGFL